MSRRRNTQNVGLLFVILVRSAHGIALRDQGHVGHGSTPWIRSAKPDRSTFQHSLVPEKRSHLDTRRHETSDVSYPVLDELRQARDNILWAKDKYDDNTDSTKKNKVETRRKTDLDKAVDADSKGGLEIKGLKGMFPAEDKYEELNKAVEDSNGIYVTDESRTSFRGYPVFVHTTKPRIMYYLNEWNIIRADMWENRDEREMSRDTNSEGETAWYRRKTWDWDPTIKNEDLDWELTKMGRHDKPWTFAYSEYLFDYASSYLGRKKSGWKVKTGTVSNDMWVDLKWVPAKVTVDAVSDDEVQAFMSQESPDTAAITEWQQKAAAVCTAWNTPKGCGLLPSKLLSWISQAPPAAASAARSTHPPKLPTGRFGDHKGDHIVTGSTMVRFQEERPFSGGSTATIVAAPSRSLVLRRSSSHTDVAVERPQRGNGG